MTVYIYINIFDAKCPLQPLFHLPKSKVGWTSADVRKREQSKIKNLFLVLLVKGQREALLLLRKRTVSAKVQDLAER